MKSIGPYVMARASSGDGAATPPPGGAARPLWATDRLTGIPVVLQPLAGALETLPALPEHPALLAPSDLLSLPGEGEFVVTELPLQAVPATDARLAARGALQALDALHRRGLVHGQVSAAHLWSVDGQVRLSGAGLPATGTPADDLRDLARALDELGGLPGGLETLRAAPETLSAGEALRRLSWAPPQEQESPAIPLLVAPLPVAPLTSQVFDLGPAGEGRTGPGVPEAVPAEETPVPAEQAEPGQAGPPTAAPSEVVLVATVEPAALAVTGPEVVPTPPPAKRGAGALARQRLRADAARAERRAAALEAGPAGGAPEGLAVPAPTADADMSAVDTASLGAPEDRAPQGPAAPLTPQERRRRLREAADAEAQAQAAAPPLTRPARPASPGPDTDRPAAAPRRELRPMRLRWTEAQGTASSGGRWQRRAEETAGAGAAAPGRPARPPALGRWRWPALAAALLVLLLGATWAVLRGRSPDQGAQVPVAGAACCSVRFELSGAAPASGVRLTLEQAPAGVELQPGAALGTAPGTVRLPGAGTYRVRVATSGFTPETVSVTVPAAAPVRIELGH